jgi:hypothetical protein
VAYSYDLGISRPPYHPLPRARKRTDVLQGNLTQEVLRDGNWPTSIRKPIYYHVFREWVKQNLSRLRLGRVTSPNKCKNKFVQEARDGVDELTKMDEMALVKIHSVNVGPISDWTLWTRETQRIQVDHLLIP